MHLLIYNRSNFQVNSKEVCEEIFSKENLEEEGVNSQLLDRKIPNGFTTEVSCVGNDFDFEEGSCNGDSGSPVIIRVSGTARKAPFYEQQFIVSDGIDCKLRATIYTRIAERRILSWIQKVTNTEPLLMVVGGFNRDYCNKLLVGVELIGNNYNRACSQAASFNEGYIITPEESGLPCEINERAALGMTGEFTKEAAIVCGGRTFDGIQDKCFEFNSVNNS